MTANDNERLAKRVVRYVPMPSGKRKRKGQLLATWEVDGEFGTEIVGMQIWSKLRWLNDTGLEAILDALGAVGGKLGAAGAKRLKEEINELVTRFNSERRNERKPPSEQDRQIQALQNSLNRSLKYLTRSRADLCRTQRFLELSPPGSADYKYRKAIKEVDVTRTINYMLDLRLLVDVHKQMISARKSRIRQPDALRYWFVWSLASLFIQTFQISTTDYEDGAWCIFLARVLTVCADKNIGNDGASTLWRNVKKAVRRWKAEAASAIKTAAPPSRSAQRAAAHRLAAGNALKARTPGA